GFSRRLIAHPGDGGKILLKRLDEGRDVHARHYDITVMSCQVMMTPTGVIMTRICRYAAVFGARRPRAARRRRRTSASGLARWGARPRASPSARARWRCPGPGPRPSARTA